MRARLAIVLALAAAPARAEPTGDVAEALALYEQGIAHYNLAEYDAAIDLFKRAYVQSEAPELLYNIAQAYRLKGNGSCGDALQFYRNYLRVAPTAPKRASVEAAIVDMERCARAERAVPPVTAVAAVSSPPPAPVAIVDEPHRARWPLVVASAGVVTAIAGAGVVAWSWSRYDAIEHSGCAPRCDPEVVDPPRTGQRAGVALAAVGVAASAAGLVLWLRDSPRPDRRAWLRPFGAGAELVASF